MDDPNVTYKAAFRALAEKLGRVPGPGDNEWLVITNNYSRSWAPAEETVTRPMVSAAGPVNTGFSRQPAPQARTGGSDAGAREAEEAVSGPRIIPTREEAVSVPDAPVSPSPDSHGPILGSRGPAGGVMAECRRCGQMWERELRRGRPAVLCEECR